MLLSCRKISKAFGENEILREVSFGIEEHEKTAIVGINGAGKSTLLRIIVGELGADRGDVIFPGDRSLGYLAQQKMLDESHSIYEELRETKKYVFDLEEQILEAERQISFHSGNGDPEHSADELLERYHRLMTVYEQENGYQAESEITGVLKGLGFREEEFGKKTGTLSGGQKTRLALGKLLLSSPDLILLDEPTNHLDIHSIRWLETYLQNYKGAVVIVAHDRYFLDKVVTKVIEIERGHAYTFSGNYTDYAKQKQEQRDAQLKAWFRGQQEIRHQEEVITKLRSFNREKSIRRAESREKMLKKMDVPEKPVFEETKMRLQLEPGIASGKDVLQAEHLAKSFGPLELFSDLNFSIQRGERVALIGDNGTGKTTILKIINGLADADGGSLTLGTNVMIGYYDQEHAVLHSDKTLFDEISDTYPYLTNTRIRDVLAAFLFTGDDVFKRICDISGGERGRVSLAKLMLSDANFLILDEPTNHLDIASREILEDAIRAYTGTLLYVSHDRYFINRTATRILDLTGKTLVNYYGNYDYYLEKHDELTARFAASKDPGALSSAKNTPNSASKEKWLESRQLQAQLRKRKALLEKTEERIGELEERDRQIDELLTMESVFRDVEKCTELTKEKAELAQELARLYQEWEELAEDR